MGRPIGERIRQVLAIVDVLEVATAKQIHSYMKGVCNQSVDKYCARAVTLGLLETSKEKRVQTYQTTQGWRDTVKDLDTSFVMSELILSTAKATQPNSVFALGRI